MRKIIAFDRVSADGYFADASGGLGWTVPEPELDRGAADNLADGGTILFGRRTYEMFESFWPMVAAADGPDAPDPHPPGRFSPELRAMARWIDQATKLVFSRTRTAAPWTNSRILGEFDPAKVEAIKGEPGSNIMIFGSGSIVSQLTEHELIDEYHLVVGPVLLGGGKTLVSGVPASLRLELIEAKPYPNGNVMLRYRRAGAEGS